MTTLICPTVFLAASAALDAHLRDYLLPFSRWEVEHRALRDQNQQHHGETLRWKSLFSCLLVTNFVAILEWLWGLIFELIHFLTKNYCQGRSWQDSILFFSKNIWSRRFSTPTQWFHKQFSVRPSLRKRIWTKFCWAPWPLKCFVFALSFLSFCLRFEEK